MGISKQVGIVHNLLKKTGYNYAFLFDYDKDINSSFRDIDVLVKVSDLVAITKSLIDGLQGQGFILFNFVDNSYSKQLYFIDENYSEVLHVDLMPEMSFRGFIYMAFDTINSDGIYYRDGLPILSLHYLFSYRIIRNILQVGSVDRDLFSSFKQIESPLREQMCCFIDDVIGEDVSSQLFETCELSSSQKNIHRKFYIKAFVKRPMFCIKNFFKHIYFTINRYINYPGIMIAFLGPDGAGKSSVIKGVCSSTVFESISQFYLLPGWLSRYKEGSQPGGEAVVDPHEREPRSLVFSLAKMFVWLVEYVAGYYMIVVKKLRLGELVLFDRYFSDMIVDNKRYRYKGPRWFVKFIGKFVPQPDVTVLLYASSETIQSRKQEVSKAETERQLVEYKQYVNTLTGGSIVDTEQKLILVVRDVNRIILEKMIIRAKKRQESFCKGTDIV